MQETKNLHDNFFKQLMSDKRAAAEFFQKYLPRAFVVLLDLKRIELMSDSFVDESLKEHLSDKLFRVGLSDGGETYIYILLEHKSFPDKWVALQLLRYLVQFWEDQRRNGASLLPFVFPFVFYHGRSHWRLNRKFLRYLMCRKS